MCSNPQETEDLVTYTEDILLENFSFVKCYYFKPLLKQCR